jgi:hypothetical protein
MEDDIDAFEAEVNALLGRVDKSVSRLRTIAKDMLEIDLEGKAERVLNEGMKVIGREHRTQAQRIDQFNKSVDQQAKEEERKEAEWAREDAAETPRRK